MIVFITYYALIDSPIIAVALPTVTRHSKSENILIFISFKFEFASLKRHFALYIYPAIKH